MPIMSCAELLLLLLLLLQQKMETDDGQVDSCFYRNRANFWFLHFLQICVTNSTKQPEP